MSHFYSFGIDWLFREISKFSFSGFDGPTEGLLRLKAKLWMQPMDGRDISDHLVTVAFDFNGKLLLERVPINPAVYIMPPTLWLSGPLGPSIKVSVSI